MIVKLFSAFFATLFFSIIFNISKYELIYCGISGFLGWLSYLLTFNLTSSVVFAAFIGALMISLYSRLLAKIRKTPVTIFSISGMIPLVPGAGMYKTVYYIIEEDYALSTHYGIESLQIAGAIAIAIILVSSFSLFQFKRS